MKSNISKYCILSPLLLLTVTALGCGSAAKKQDATVQGTVTIDGELATTGTVAFHPTGGGPIAYGNIHKDGSYSLRTGQGNMRDADKSKIISGDYVVSVVVTTAPQMKPQASVVEPQQEGAEDSTAASEGQPDGELSGGVGIPGSGGPPMPGVRLTAAKYANKETSDLRFTVKPGLNVFALSLESTSNKLEQAENDTDTATAVSEAVDADRKEESP